MFTGMIPIDNLDAVREMLGGDAPNPGCAIGGNTRLVSLKKVLRLSSFQQRGGKRLDIAQDGGIGTFYGMDLGHRIAFRRGVSYHTSNEAYLEFFPALLTNVDHAA